MKELLYFDQGVCSTVLKSRSHSSERVSRCSRLMAVYSPEFNDRWRCKRALAMHMPSNGSVLFPLEMQGITEEFKKILEEEEDGLVVLLKVENKPFIKRVFHH